MDRELSLAVCDDDEIVCEAICNRISTILSGCGINAVCDKYISPTLLYKNVNGGARSYDLVFLDIDMPKASGIDLAKALRKIGKTMDIVFVSNREDKVFDTFSVRPFGFVRKNNFSHDLNDTLRSYINLKVLSDSFIVLKTVNNSVTRNVRVADIVYIESFRYKQYVYMADGEQIDIHMTMKELESKLAQFDIVRAYQGYLVNLKYVQRIERTGIILNYKDGVTINISRDKVQELKTLYLKYLRKIGAVIFDDN
ncbi:MAG: LytR/AlgR family response regulator transcription factor [Candidatus Coproplasma sp.]